MRPLRISIEGLRSFRARVDVDFGARTQIAVIGDTGAGKSSILEAMTYALYGQTSLGGRSKQELMNDTSDTMRVVLRFQVAGEEWEVARVDRRTGAGGLRPAKAKLVQYGAGGEALDMVEGVRSVNERAQALIGLEREAFLRTVVLPQGRFARLLVEDGPKERAEILRQLWPTGDLEEAGRAAGRRLADVKVLAARLQQEVARHPDDPAEHLALLERWADATEREAAALESLRDSATEARDALARSEATVAAADSARRTVIPGALDELLLRLSPVEGAQRRINADIAEQKRRESSLTRDLNSIPADDGPDHRVVAKALAVLEALPEQAEQAVAAGDALRAAMAREGSAKARQTEAQRALESAEDRLTRHQTLEPPLAEAVKSAEERVRNTEQEYRQCEDLRTRIRSNRDELAKRREGIAEIAARLAAARGDEDRAGREAERAEAAMRAAQRGNAAATAAHGLHEGDECPVCRRDLPAGWSPPPDEGIGAAREALEAARSQVAGASRSAAALQADEASGRRRIADDAWALDELGAEMAEALRRLGGAAGLDGIEGPRDAAPDDPRPAGPDRTDAPLPDRAAVLAPAGRRLREAERRLEEHGAEAEALRKAAADALRAGDAARQTLMHVREKIDGSRNAAAAAMDSLSRSVLSVDAAFRPRLSLPADPLQLAAFDTAPVDRASYAAREREEILDMRETKRNRLRKGIEEARTALKRLEDDRRTEVETPTQAILRSLDDHRAALVDGIRPLEARAAEARIGEAQVGEAPQTAKTVVPARLHYPAPPDALREGIGRLREAMEAALQLADRLRRNARTAIEEARATARAVARRLVRLAEDDAHGDVDILVGLAGEPAADAADLAPLVRHATDASGEARYAARDAAQARTAFAAVLDDVIELRRTAAEADALELALGDLDAALKAGAFLKWLTMRRSRDLLVHASKMLERMTGGRYSFADPGDRDDQQWMVVDNDSGQARSPASVSGGEQFIGSLALALGMVEMMARSGGRLESLFLDEGFGSLDRSNLDSAIEALSAVAGTGRMVGVISHVAAVAEQIDDVLAVTRGASGSQATWLSRAEREELSHSDAGLEGASALAGLLQ